MAVDTSWLGRARAVRTALVPLVLWYAAYKVLLLSPTILTIVALLVVALVGVVLRGEPSAFLAPIMAFDGAWSSLWSQSTGFAFTVATFVEDVAAALAVVVALWLGRRFGVGPSSALGDRPARAPGTSTYHVVAVGLGVGFAILDSALQGWFRPPTSPSGGIPADALDGGTLWLLAWLAVMALAAPPVEELVARGFAWNALARVFPVPVVCVATTLGFAFVHGDRWWKVLATSILFGLLRASSRSLVPSMLMHMTYNVVILLLYAAGTSTTDLLVRGAIGALASVASGMVWYRAWRRERPGSAAKVAA